MTNFGEALRKGLDSHKQAEEAHKELSEILAAASKDMSEVLNEEISLQFEVIGRPARAQSSVEQLAGVPAPRENITALTAKLRRSKFEMLAEATFGELGYPVTLRWENEFRLAPDRDAFEAVLQELLARSGTGAKIKKLLTGT